MAKYIIDVPDEAVSFMDGEMSFFVEPKIKDERRRHYVLRIDEEDVSIYTEPDRGAIEDEVWKMARLISLDGGLSSPDLYECYKSSDIQKVMRTHSYQEAKAKYDAWKQEKEEIHVGDEVISTFGDKMVVTHHWNQNDGTTGVSGFSADCSGLYYDEIEVEKTGRHFPEVEELLKKLVGEQND